MKIKIIQLCALICLLFQIDVQAQNSTSYTAVSDSYVVKGSPTTNYGTGTDLQIKGSTGGANNRKGYLKFDITGGSATAAQIVLKLVKSGGEELNLTAQSTATSWTETAINWNNAPEGLMDVSQGYFRQGDEIFMDITDYVKSKIGSSQYTISLLLSSNDIIGSPFKIHSREGADPLLKPAIVFYTTKQINFSKPITLSRYVSSDMVIQRGKPFPFMGQGEPGETINIDFLRENVSTKIAGVVDAQGNFSISIPAMTETATPCTAILSVTGHPEKTIILSNILIGDVWFAGGQSNMEKKVDYLLEANAVIADANNFKNIRAFRAEYNSIIDPTDVVKPQNASWIVCDSDNVSNASAVAYIFAKKIYQETGIPIGIMQAYVGGTEIETWLSADKIRDDKKLQFLEDRIPDYDKNASNFYQVYPSVNYNGMVNPLRFFPVKGFLFYQGESNVKRAPEYGILMRALIQNYRSKWDLGDIPFYFVQVANMGIASNRNYEATADNNTWQMIRLQQLQVYQNSGLTNLGMAVIIETNEERLNPDNNIRIHPHNKMPVGDRLSKIALKEQYGKNIVAYSPLVEKTWVQGKKVFIQMKNVGSGLKIRTNESALVGFAIGNSSETYFDATATIEGTNLISVQTNSVSKPAYIAYGWSRDPLCTLDNSANLPASPFKMAVTTKKELQIIQDAFIKNGNQSNSNSGSSTELRVESGSPESRTYIKIDLSDLLFTTVVNAKLRITASSTAAATISASTVSNTWIENQITWNNAPQTDQFIATIAVNNGATTYDLDLTNLITTALANEEETISIELKATAGSAIFFSKESSQDQPLLIVNEEGGTLSTTTFANTANDFLIYPNPVKANILNISSKNTGENLSKVALVNVLGQYFPFSNASNASEYQLDLSGFSSGTYILVLETANEKFHKKIIIP